MIGLLVVLLTGSLPRALTARMMIDDESLHDNDSNALSTRILLEIIHTAQALAAFGSWFEISTAIVDGPPDI